MPQLREPDDFTADLADLAALQAEPDLDGFEADLAAVAGPAVGEPSLARRAMRRLSDVGISAIKGAIGVPESIVGLADIPTGGRVGRFLESAVGFQPATAKAILNQYYSEAQQRGFRSVEEAKGVVKTAAAALMHPSVILQSVVESAPLMLTGGGIARAGLTIAPRLGPLVAGAIGEGAVSAGSTAEQIRATRGGALSPTQGAVSAASGAITGALGVFGGKLAARLGIADVDTLLAGAVANRVARRNLAKQVVLGALQEGFLEELPQSIQEQVLQNAAVGAPLNQGVDANAVLGALAGAVMGGGTQAVGGLVPARPAAEMIAPESQRPMPIQDQAPPVPAPRVPPDLGAVSESPLPFEPPRPTLEPSDVGLSVNQPVEASDLSQSRGIAPAGTLPEGRDSPRLSRSRLSKVRQAEADALDELVNLATRQGFTGDSTTLRQALQQRADDLREINADLDEQGATPAALLKAIVDGGGISQIAKTAAWLRESDLAKKRGLFRRDGLTLDGMVDHLRQDPRFPHIETSNDLVDELSEIASEGTGDQRTITARAIGAVGGQWWDRMVPTAQSSEEVSFNPAELESRAIPTEQVDALKTGEGRPPLPEATSVASQSHASPSKTGEGRPPLPEAGPPSFESDLKELETRRGVQRAGYRMTGQPPPIPPTQQIPRERLLEFPSIQKMPEGIRQDIVNILETHGGFEAQRRGVQSVERTQALAARIVVPLRRLRPGTALNAEELSAYGDALASVLTERQATADRVASGRGSDLDRLELAKLTNEAVVLTANYRGAKAEAGRALNILRQQARLLEFGDAAFMAAALKAPGFQEQTQRLAEAIGRTGGDPLAQLKFLREHAGGSWWMAAYYNSLLSGVKTHERNVIGNTFNVLANILTPLGAAPMAVARSIVSGKSRDVYLGEIPVMMKATALAMPDAWREFAFTLRHGFTPRTVERATMGAFDTPRAELPGGAITNLPTRLLDAADVFFRRLGRQQELYAGAYALARRQVPLAEVPTRMAELLVSTSDEAKALRQRADDFSVRAVFQEDPGAFVNALLKMKADTAIPIELRVALTFLIPFVRTPANILRQGLEFSAVGFAMREARREGRPGVQAQGRAALGLLAVTPLVLLAMSQRLSGNGPEDPAERAALYEKGWQPNSIKIGKTWVRYQLFQPMSIQLAAVANGYEAFLRSDRKDESAERSVSNMLAGIGASLLDQSFLSGLNGFLEAIADPERNAQRFLTSFAQSLVPASGLLRNITQATDPVIRKPGSIREAVKTIVPGLSRTVSPRLTRFGEPALRPGGPIRRGFIVPEMSTERAEVVSDTLALLDIFPAVPRARLVRRGERLPLTTAQAQMIELAIGVERKVRLTREVTSPAFQQSDDETNKRILHRILTDTTGDVNRRAIRLLEDHQLLTLDALAPSVGDIVASPLAVPAPTATGAR